MGTAFHSILSVNLWIKLVFLENCAARCPFSDLVATAARILMQTCILSLAGTEVNLSGLGKSWQKVVSAVGLKGKSSRPSLLWWWWWGGGGLGDGKFTHIHKMWTTPYSIKKVHCSIWWQTAVNPITSNCYRQHSIGLKSGANTMPLLNGQHKAHRFHYFFWEPRPIHVKNRTLSTKL